MSESKQMCPFCSRLPGEVHNEFCSRSTQHQTNIKSYDARVAMLRSMRIPLVDSETGEKDSVLVDLSNKIAAVKIRS